MKKQKKRKGQLVWQLVVLTTLEQEIRVSSSSIEYLLP